MLQQLTLSKVYIVANFRLTLLTQDNQNKMKL